MEYIGYYFNITPVNPGSEILMAELGELGFDSFVETENGLEAYIPKSNWSEKILVDIYVLNSNEFTITYEFKEIAQVNWNQEWEKNFEPIQVDDTISVIAPFHKKTNLPYEIVIEPKMSFGTGHHATTHLMLKHLLSLDLQDKTVLDMGTGTGILAIFAAMKGSTKIDAIDIDEWCYINTIENIERNNCSFIKAYQGDASLLTNQQYDVIIANINRNILINDMAAYAKCLKSGGILLLSGFYIEDIEAIEKCTNTYGITLANKYDRENWAGLQLVKN